jgi:acetyl esterase/lipase
MPWPWLFLGVTLVGAWFTFNAYLPHRRLGPLTVPSFFAGWLTSELSAHHFAWQLAATVFFVWMGALEAWPGWLGLGITLASWVGLLAMVPVSGRAKDVVEDALVDALGDDYAAAGAPALAEAARVASAPRGRLLNPFRLHDPTVQRIGDIAYEPDGHSRHRLDVYVPRAGVSNAPVLLQIHGGGWVIGDKRQQALPLMLHLASRGWICVAANYRRSPRVAFPEHLIDCKRAMRWIRSHIADYGGNPDFVVATGGSAGGHLSSMVALTANDPRYQPGFERVDTSVQACVPFYGVYDFSNAHEKWAHGGMQDFLERVVMQKKLDDDREAFEAASPMHRVRPDAPPFFVIHGSHDSLAPVEEARQFVRRLRRDSRAPVAYAEVPGAQHAFEVFHSLRTRHVVAGVDRFLDCIHARWRVGTGSATAATGL